MRRYLLFALFCLGLSRAQAQEDTLLLLGKLIVQGEEDTVRANLLIEIAEAYAESDPGKFDQYATEALRLCDKLKYYRGAARIGRDIGRHHQIYVHDEFGAVEVYVNALRAAERAGDTLMVAQLYTDIGGAYVPLQRDSLSEDYLARAVRLARTHGDTSLWSRALYSLARLRSLRGRIAEALDIDRAGLRLALAKGDSSLQAKHEMSMGLSFNVQENADSAVYYLERAAAIFDTLEDHRFLAYTLGQLALVNWNSGGLANADSLAARGLRIALRYDLRKETMDNYRVLALLAAKRGDYKEAYANQVLYNAYFDSATN
ncbi:MAG TPA: hypothetical protein VHL57_11550, partial [Flavobacteriales bacterium]|nr:hypothetical protein [Flavobacteriales bacterium]